MTEYLKLDSARVSLGEYWRWKPGIPFVVLAGRKVFGWRLDPTVLVPAVAKVEVVDPQSQPPELVGALAEPIHACEARGRTIELWYTVPVIGANVGLAAALVSQDRLSVALSAVSQARGGAYREVVLGLVSRLRNGRFLSTSAGKALFNPPPEVELLRLVGRSYTELVEAHDVQMGSRRSEIEPCRDTFELVLQLQRLQTQANVARGIYVPASRHDVERVKSGEQAP